MKLEGLTTGEVEDILIALDVRSQGILENAGSFSLKYVELRELYDMISDQLQVQDLINRTGGP